MHVSVRWLAAAALSGSAMLSSGTVASAQEPGRVAAPRTTTLQAPGWTGFYIGGALGFRAAEADATLRTFLQNGVDALPGFCAILGGCSGQEFDSAGFKGGVYAGFNWHFAPRFVAGIEADWMWADHETVRRGLVFPSSAGQLGVTANASDSFSVAAEWDASLRARLGFLLTPSVMVFATGGASWISTQSTSICVSGVIGCAAPFFATPGTVTNSDTVLGWTIGAGVEAMLSPNWLIRGEYRYADYGTNSYTVTRNNVFGVNFNSTYDVDLRTHTALVGLAYRFGGGASPLSGQAQAFAETIPSIANWSGFYIGAAAGLRAADADGNLTALLFDGVDTLPASCAATGCAGQPFDSSGFKGGFYGGYNWHFAPAWVAGLEGDWMWAKHEAVLHGALLPTSVGGTALTGIGTDSFTVEAAWDASLRGRLGYLITPSVMVFATGGVSWMHLETASSCSPAFGFCAAPVSLTPTTVTNSDTLVGWTIGAGFEAALSRNWLIRGEYRYADYGTRSYAISRATAVPAPATITAIYDMEVQTHTALFGIAYKFDWGSAPQATKH